MYDQAPLMELLVKTICEVDSLQIADEKVLEACDNFNQLLLDLKWPPRRQNKNFVCAILRGSSCNTAYTHGQVHSS
jgi:hypothetical protein